MDLVICIGPWHVFWFGWPAHKFFPTKVNGAPSAESETSWKYLSNNSKKLPFRFTAIFIKYSYGQTESSRARERFPVLFEICCCWILSSLRFCDYGSSKLEKNMYLRIQNELLRVFRGYLALNFKIYDFDFEIQQSDSFFSVLFLTLYYIAGEIERIWLFLSLAFFYVLFKFIGFENQIRYKSDQFVSRHHSTSRTYSLQMFLIIIHSFG